MFDCCVKAVIVSLPSMSLLYSQEQGAGSQPSGKRLHALLAGFSLDVHTATSLRTTFHWASSLCIFVSPTLLPIVPWFLISCCIIMFLPFPISLNHFSHTHSSPCYSFCTLVMFGYSLVGSQNTWSLTTASQFCLQAIHISFLKILISTYVPLPVFYVQQSLNARRLHATSTQISSAWCILQLSRMRTLRGPGYGLVRGIWNRWGHITTHYTLSQEYNKGFCGNRSLNDIMCDYRIE